ncbi:MAG: CMP-N,N'-diacetyllegionaminic acid synthase, partial [Sulfurimonas sp.]
MKILGIIPARGGSKGIPKKNIKLLRNKPLIAYTIEAALASNLNGVIVSTDCKEIADISKEYG